MGHGISGRVTDENTPRETADAQGRREETQQKPHRHIGSLAIFEAKGHWRSGTGVSFGDRGRGRMGTVFIRDKYAHRGMS
eukprot:3117717-Prymnesium_polylepis.1